MTHMLSIDKHLILNIHLNFSFYSQKFATLILFVRHIKISNKHANVKHIHVKISVSTTQHASTFTSEDNKVAADITVFKAPD